MSDYDFLGSGIAFPFRFGETTGAVVGSEGLPPEYARIRESIRQILSTRPGERFFRPEFGSRLGELVFEQNDVVLKALLKRYVVDAIGRWEKRVRVTRVEFGQDPLETDRNRFSVKITYQVIGSQVEGNLVYPFVREA